MTALPTITPIEPSTELGRLETPAGNLPLVAVDVTARIAGLTVATTVTQVFRNAASQPLEATYIFPLPDRASVTRFTARIGDRVVEGVLKERGEARREYDEALAAGHRAAIAEQERSDVFTVRVGNIPTGERAEIALDLVGPLAMDGDEATFRFPLVVAPRYMPGSPTRGADVGAGVAWDTDEVPDASRISPPVLLPGQRSPVRLSVRAEIDSAGLAVHGLASSLHAVATDDQAGRTVVQVQPGDRLDRDFVLRFRVGAAAMQTVAAVQRDADGEEATLAVTVVPPASDPQASPAPRDVVVLLDRSGSMMGWKMTAARRAAARIVDALTSADRVAVLAFDDVVERDAEAASLHPATDRHRFAATRFLSGLEARGGTEMLAALQHAADLFGPADPGRRRILVLVTDGQIGDEDRIVAIMRGSLNDATVHVVGIDRAVSAGILRRLAGLGSGAGHAEFVESQDRLDEALGRIRNRIAEPVLRDLQLAVDGAELLDGSIVPAGGISCPAGVPVVVRARVRDVGEQAITLRLHGRDAAGGGWNAVVPALRTEGAAEASIWAREHLRLLEDHWLTESDGRAELRERMTAQSLRFGVLCRFTAFVAVDRTDRVGDGSRLSVVQPVEAPSGWDLDAGYDAFPAPLGGWDMNADGAVFSAFPSPLGSAAPAPPRPVASRGLRLRRSVPTAPEWEDVGPGADTWQDILDRIERVLDTLEIALGAGDETLLRQTGKDVKLLVKKVARLSRIDSHDPAVWQMLSGQLRTLVRLCKARGRDRAETARELEAARRTVSVLRAGGGSLPA